MISTVVQAAYRQIGRKDAVADFVPRRSEVWILARKTHKMASSVPPAARLVMAPARGTRQPIVNGADFIGGSKTVSRCDNNCQTLRISAAVTFRPPSPPSVSAIRHLHRLQLLRSCHQTGLQDITLATTWYVIAARSFLISQSRRLGQGSERPIC
jgi:hypothetical protein